MRDSLGYVIIFRLIYQRDKMELQNIGIVGLGLMGGSLGLALKKSLPWIKIYGLDHNTSHQQEAISMGIVDTTVTTFEDLVATCEVIVLCIPVNGIIDILQQITSLPENITLIDFGSTKEEICQQTPQHLRHFLVAAHPMTGTEKHGPKAALLDLYKNKTVVLCDLQASGAHQRKVAQYILDTLEMNIIQMDASSHDKHAAFISHMPHAISYALANSVMKQEDAKSIVALAGGGFRDMSRIAKSSPSMWEAIFRQNKKNLIDAISSFQEELQECKTMIENEEWEKLNDWMKQANKLHEIL